MELDRVLSCALDVGEHMLVSGAEVYRVEDCIRRICFAYGATDVDVFSITSSILCTVEEPGGHRFSQTRRIEGMSTNLDRVHRLNDLSRTMCRERIDFPEFKARFQAIMDRKAYPTWVETVVYAVIAASFTVFFQGSWRDAAVSAIIGVILKGVVSFNSAVRFNRVLSNLIATFVISLLAFLSVDLGLADAADMIVIGNIMPLIPGVGFTNSLRDMVSGDTMTGMLRFAEACIHALAIAGGYFLAAMALGGL